MLGKFTFLFDYAHRIPIRGKLARAGAFPLWARDGGRGACGRGVERLVRDAGVSLEARIDRGGLAHLALDPDPGSRIRAGVEAVERLEPAAKPPSIPLAGPRALDRCRAHRDLVRIGLVGGPDRATGVLASSISRARWVAVLAASVIADLLGSHWYDVPTVDPAYWTVPPESVVQLKADPGLIRVFGKADKSAAEPGYVSEEIDFLGVRDQLDWSLPVVWNVYGSRGETPIIPQRYLDLYGPRLDRRRAVRYRERHARAHGAGEAGEDLAVARALADKAFIHRNARALPRVRLAGKPRVRQRRDRGDRPRSIA